MATDREDIPAPVLGRRAVGNQFGVQFVVVKGKPVLSVTGIVDGDCLPTLQRLLDRLTLADFSSATIDLRDAVPIGRGVMEELEQRARDWESHGKRLEVTL